MEKEGIAFLSNDGRYTVFTFEDVRLKVIAPYSLERYVSVVLWDKGYLIAMAKYSHMEEPEEEYIDLVPVLEDLHIDTENFVSRIKMVEVKYA